MTIAVTPPARTLRLQPQDNVVVAVDVLEAGKPTSEGLEPRARVPKGHKMATVGIPAGTPVLKFGQIIGFATQPIAPGDWVHEHNLAMGPDFERDYQFAEGAMPDRLLPASEQATFQGFRRVGGKAGTRNYLAILTSVNCSASVARFMAKEVERSGILGDYPNIDGVIALVHGTGCGMADKGAGFEALKRTQWGYATNPNIAGVLLVGLGCEVFQIGRMKAEYGLGEGEHFQTMTIQDTGGTKKTVEGGVARLRGMMPAANAARRETISASELMLALQCGGSDGYSGITGEPGAGRRGRHAGRPWRHRYPVRDARDLRGRAPAHASRRQPRRRRKADPHHPLVGGLHEAQRRRDEQQPVARQQGGRLDHYSREVARGRGQGWHPQPRRRVRLRRTGEHQGFRVYGHARFTIRFRRPVRWPAGPTSLCFTTGRGSAYGCKPTPSIKLATNSDTFRRMTDDMDINCGDVLDGVTIAEKGREIFDRILAVASGEPSKSEALGYGDAEFVPWQIGATM